MLYEMIFGMRPFEKHCPITYVKYLDQIYSKYPICESFRSLTEASVHLSTPSSQGDHRPSPSNTERRQSCPHFSNDLTPELSLDSLKNTSSSDDSASLNLKIIRSSPFSSRYCSGLEKMDDPSWKNEIKIGDVKLEIKLRIPMRNIRSQKVSRECRWFFQQLFDPLPWARKDWKDFASLATLPWFQRHELSADNIATKTAQPPYVPSLTDIEFAQKLSAVREKRISANGDGYRSRGTKKRGQQQPKFTLFPNNSQCGDEFNIEEQKCSDHVCQNDANCDKTNLNSTSNLCGRSTYFKNFCYVNEMYHRSHSTRRV